MHFIQCFRVILLLNGLFINISLATSGFILMAPKYLLAGSKERVCVSLHAGSRSTNETPVHISLTDVNQTVISTTSANDLIQGNVTCVTLNIPFTNITEARLRLHFPTDDGFLPSNDLINLSEHILEIKQDPLVTIVAVEKPIYRPGEVLRFRVLSLTHKLKVYKKNLKRVWVESPNGITLEQWLNVKTETGLNQFDFSLSDESLLGLWKIKVQHGHINSVEEGSFTVKEYVLPRFEVFIKQPKEILGDADTITFEICAKYSYGAVVKGTLHLELDVKSKFEDIQRPKILFEAKLDTSNGCTNTTILGSEIYLTDSEVQTEKLIIKAIVTESSSKKSENSTAELDIKHSAIELQFHCSEYFKPGLPYKGKVKVLSAGGLPTVAVDVPIQICMTENNINIQIYKQCWNYSSDYSSEVMFTLPPRPNTTNLITVTAVSLQHDNKYYAEEPKVQLLMIRPKAVQELKPWYSPSRSFIDVSTVSPVVCNTLHSLHVQYTVVDFTDETPQFYYLVESRGDLLHIGTMKPDNEKQLINKVLVGFPPARAFILPLLITHDMAPEARLIIYYTRSDGEIVAASTVLSVDKCFLNKVRARWSKHTAHPGDNVSLNIHAHPNSICAINVVDLMINKYNFRNTFSSDILWKKLDIYKTPFLKQSPEYCNDKLPIPPITDTIPDGDDLRRRKRWFKLPYRMYDYVDASTAFNDMGVVVLTDLALETRPCSNNSDNAGNMIQYGRKFFGSNTGDNDEALFPLPLVKDEKSNLNDEDHKPGSRSRNLDRNNFRHFFPESWLWNLTTINNIGEQSLDVKTPHSITTWDASVFCIHDQKGFGLSEISSLVTFQPFFLTVDTPSSFIRTETLPVTVTIYNYLGHSIPVEITLTSSSDVKIVGPNSTKECMKELSPVSYTFNISVAHLGEENIIVTAAILPALNNCSPGVYEGVSDTVVKVVKVKAEGFPITKIFSQLFCGNDNLKSQWNLSLPLNIVPQTARAKVIISPEILGPALQGIGDFIEMPVGCGEQNMIKVAPNIKVLQYLNVVNVPDSEILKEKIIRNIQKGYQRQLLYRHDDGSFSAFGPKSSSVTEGSLWLTAFVLNNFGQAINIITIDHDKLQETFKWIISKQLENGCFAQVGEVFQKELKGGLSDSESITALTAFVITSLYKSGQSIPSSVISNAEFCLAADDNIKDVYNLAIITYAFTLLNYTSRRAENNLRKLIQISNSDQDLVWWEKPGSSMAINVEVTGYAILSLIKNGGPDNMVLAHKAVKWISMQRNNKGGFISTQDTVIGLEALTSFALTLPHIHSTLLSINVQYLNNEINSQLTKSTLIDNRNRMVQKEFDVPLLPQMLSVNTEGEGCALVQAVLRYNVDEIEKTDAFELSVRIEPLSDFDLCYYQKINLCVCYTLPNSTSNMIIVVINYVTGYVPDRTSLYQMTGVERWEEDEVDNKLIIYLKEVKSIPTCFGFIFEHLHYVNNAESSTIAVTDYYHPELNSLFNYRLTCDEIPRLDEIPQIFLDSTTNRF